MTDAQSAVIDIQDALSEFGSVITLHKVVFGTYDPATGVAAETITTTNIKAIVTKWASEHVANAFKMQSEIEGTTSSYELALMLYHTEPIEKGWRVVFRGDTYEVIFVMPSILQDTIYKYDILVKI